jgi:hypothetical protein
VDDRHEKPCPSRCSSKGCRSAASTDKPASDVRSADGRPRRSFHRRHARLSGRRGGWQRKLGERRPEPIRFANEQFERRQRRNRSSAAGRKRRSWICRQSRRNRVNDAGRRECWFFGFSSWVRIIQRLRLYARKLVREHGNGFNLRRDGYGIGPRQRTWTSLGHASELSERRRRSGLFRRWQRFGSRFSRDRRRIAARRIQCRFEFGARLRIFDEWFAGRLRIGLTGAWSAASAIVRTGIGSARS